MNNPKLSGKKASDENMLQGKNDFTHFDLKVCRHMLGRCAMGQYNINIVLVQF